MLKLIALISLMVLVSSCYAPVQTQLDSGPVVSDDALYWRSGNYIFKLNDF